jgi:hypothetical protein
MRPVIFLIRERLRQDGIAMQIFTILRFSLIRIGIIHPEHFTSRGFIQIRRDGKGRIYFVIRPLHALPGIPAGGKCEKEGNYQKRDNPGCIH